MIIPPNTWEIIQAGNQFFSLHLGGTAKIGEIRRCFPHGESSFLWKNCFGRENWFDCCHGKISQVIRKINPSEYFLALTSPDSTFIWKAWCLFVHPAKLVWMFSVALKTLFYAGAWNCAALISQNMKPVLKAKKGPSSVTVPVFKHKKAPNQTFSLHN